MGIDEQHIAEPGLVVLEVAAADEGTVRAVMEGLQRQWATSGISRRCGVRRASRVSGLGCTRTYAAPAPRPSRNERQLVRP